MIQGYLSSGGLGPLILVEETTMDRRDYIEIMRKIVALHREIFKGKGYFIKTVMLLCTL